MVFAEPLSLYMQILIYGTPEIVIIVVLQIHTSKGCGGGGGRLATLAALCLSTSRARLRASARLGGQKQNKPQERRETENYSSNSDRPVQNKR